MSPSPQRQPTDVRQAEIVLTLLQLAATRSALDITTTDIAKAMKVSQGALFRHFPSKEAIRLAVVEWIESSLMQRLDAACEAAECPLDALRAMFLAHLDFFIAYPGAPRFVFGELQHPDRTPVKERVRELIAAYRQRLDATLEAAVRLELLPETLNRPAAAALFLGAIQGLVIQSMVTGALEEMRTPAVAVLDLYLQGLHAAS